MGSFDDAAAYRNPFLRLTGVAAASYSGYNTSNGHGVAVKTDGTVWTIGKNSSGQLGQGDYTDRDTWTQISGETGAVNCLAEGATTWIIYSSGAVKACGSNQYGALGDNTSVSDSNTLVSTLISNVTDIVRNNTAEMQKNTQNSLKVFFILLQLCLILIGWLRN